MRDPGALGSSESVRETPIILPPVSACAVVPNYDENHALCIEPRAARDCRGPGAFINPLVSAGRSADRAGSGDRNGAAAGDGRDPGDDRHQSGRNRDQDCDHPVDDYDNDPDPHRSCDEAGA